MLPLPQNFPLGGPETILSRRTYLVTDCNYCFSTATVVTRTLPDLTFVLTLTLT